MDRLLAEIRLWWHCLRNLHRTVRYYYGGGMVSAKCYECNKLYYGTFNPDGWQKPRPDEAQE